LRASEILFPIIIDVNMAGTLSLFDFVDAVILPIFAPYFNIKRETIGCFLTTFSCILTNY